MSFPKPNLKEFIENNGKYLALINRHSDNYTNYLTLFIVEDEEKAIDDIETIVNELGECSTCSWNFERVDYFIDGQWYFLIDYTGGVIECK